MVLLSRCLVHTLLNSLTQSLFLVHLLGVLLREGQTHHLPQENILIGITTSRLAHFKSLIDGIFFTQALYLSFLCRKLNDLTKHVILFFVIFVLLLLNCSRLLECQLQFVFIPLFFTFSPFCFIPDRPLGHLFQQVRVQIGRIFSRRRHGESSSESNVLVQPSMSVCCLLGLTLRYSLVVLFIILSFGSFLFVSLLLRLGDAQ
mmetsp:Transcript_8206/g.18383  ORF Transcript_8206/g.18383 Transcript_8206/m.18383 type:complete len:203 (+) Transcript_8206:1581-2189(+)